MLLKYFKMDMSSFLLTLQSSKSRNVCLLIFEINQDSLGDVILLTSQGVSFTEVQEGFLASQGVSFTEVQEGLIVRREVNALRKALSALLGFCPRYS